MGPPPSSRARRLLGLGVLLVFAVGAVFAGALRNGLVWDDTGLTTANPFLASTSGIAKLVSSDLWSAAATEERSPYYRPLPMLSFALNRALLGNSAASYHAGSLALHAVNAVLLLVLLARLFPERPPRAAVFLPALLFAIAPVNVETAAYVAARMDLLGSSFALAALVANAQRGAGARAWSALWVFAALLSKESFVVLPVIVALEDAFLDRPLRAELPKYGALAALVLAMFGLRALVGVPSASVAATTGLLAIARSYVFLFTTFARLLVVPAYLDPFRAYREPSLGATAFFFAAAIVAVGFVVARRSQIASRPEARAVVFGAAWMALALAPSSLAIPSLAIVGERYAYFPLMGAFVASAAVLDAVWPRARALAAASLVLGVSLAVSAALRSRTRVRDWEDETTLYGASLRGDPVNAYSLYGLGEIDAVAGRYDDAMRRLKASLAEDPLGSRAWTALCFVDLRVGRPEEAEVACVRSLEIQPENPRSWINLAAARVARRDWRLGLVAADGAVARKGNSAEAHYLRAACLANLAVDDGGGLDPARIAEASRELDRALALDPKHAGALGLQRQFVARGLR